MSSSTTPPTNNEHINNDDDDDDPLKYEEIRHLIPAPGEKKTQDDDSKKPNNKTNKETEKKKGGGQTLNSYLKIYLDDNSVDKMHRMALSIREAAKHLNDHEESGDHHDDDDDDDDSPPKTTTSKKRKTRLSFKPRSRQSLHMTFFFGGDVLCSLQPDDLERWHSRVRQITIQRNEQQQQEEEATHSGKEENEKKQQTKPNTTSSANDDDDDDDDDRSEYTMRFRELVVFPPQRKNLIVAVFDAPPVLHTLYGSIMQMSKKEMAGTPLADIVKKNKGSWTPHVTLGNIGGWRKKRDLMKALKNAEEVLLSAGMAELLLDRKEEEEEVVEEFVALAKGLTMGGPVPDQIELDWDFPF